MHFHPDLCVFDRINLWRFAWKHRVNVLDANIYQHHKGSTELRGVEGEGNTFNAPWNVTDALSNTLHAPSWETCGKQSSCRSFARFFFFCCLNTVYNYPQSEQLSLHSFQHPVPLLIYLFHFSTPKLPYVGRQCGCVQQGLSGGGGACEMV